MMQIRIAGLERELNLNHIDESWINQQINLRKAERQLVCVQVKIKEDQLNLLLATPTCASEGGGWRPPTSQESRIFDLWRRHGLDDREFSGGNVVAFLKQLRKCI